MCSFILVTEPAQRHNTAMPQDDLEKAVELAAEELDYSTAEDKELVAHFVWASKELHRMRGQLADVYGVLNNPDIPKSPEIQSLCVEILSRCMNLSVSLLAITQSTLPEIFKRAGKNKTNWNFGLLKLAADLCDLKLQENVLGHLYGLALGLARKKNWRHPEGNNGWKGVANETLCKELAKHKELNFSALLEHMVGNQFAYIWTAWEKDFIDELRRLEKRPKTTEMDESIAAIPSFGSNPSERYEQTAFIEYLKAGAQRFKRSTGVVLEAMAELLATITGESIAELRARIVKEVAKRRGVSLQQARKDVERLADTKDAGVEEFKAQLRASANQSQPLPTQPDRDTE
jgi:hypothetical protein